jgi:hypothetical protein
MVAGTIPQARTTAHKRRRKHGDIHIIPTHFKNLSPQNQYKYHAHGKHSQKT